MSPTRADHYDVAVVGGGPAGLSAAIVLGRCRRRVVLFDHGQPRNAAAQGVHCYLAAEGTAPLDLRRRGREEARSYGVELVDQEVVAASCAPPDIDGRRGFELRTAQGTFFARKLLLATGLVDVLPDVPGLKELYGRSVHHCPYCDGWEHRDQRLAAFGGEAAVGLSLSLRTWSSQVTLLSHGQRVADPIRKQLEINGVAWREEKVERLVGENGVLAEVRFESGPPLDCDALFFHPDKVQRSRLPERLGCATDEKGLIASGKKQTTDVAGLYLAGDADGDVQFAIVAAAEGATAAIAINRDLQEENRAGDH